MDRTENNSIGQRIWPQTCRRETSILLGIYGAAVVLWMRDRWAPLFASADRTWSIISQAAVVGTVGGVSALCLPRLLPKNFLQNLDKNTVHVKTDVLVRYGLATLTMDDVDELSLQDLERCLDRYNDARFIQTMASLHLQNPTRFKAIYLQMSSVSSARRMLSTLPLLKPRSTDLQGKEAFGGLCQLLAEIGNSDDHLVLLSKLDQEQHQIIPLAYWKKIFENFNQTEFATQNIERIAGALLCVAEKIPEDAEIAAGLTNLISRLWTDEFKAVIQAFKEDPRVKNAAWLQPLLEGVVKSLMKDLRVSYQMNIATLISVDSTLLSAVLASLKEMPSEKISAAGRHELLQQMFSMVDFDHLDPRSKEELKKLDQWIVGPGMERDLSEFEQQVAQLSDQVSFTGKNGLQKLQQSLDELSTRLEKWRKTSTVVEASARLWNVMASISGSSTTREDKPTLKKATYELIEDVLHFRTSSKNRGFGLVEFMRYRHVLSAYKSSNLTVWDKLAKSSSSEVLKQVLAEARQKVESRLIECVRRYDAVQQKLQPMIQPYYEIQLRLMSLYGELSGIPLALTMAEENDTVGSMGACIQALNQLSVEDILSDADSAMFSRINRVCTLCSEALQRVDRHPITKIESALAADYLQREKDMFSGFGGFLSTPQDDAEAHVQPLIEQATCTEIGRTEVMQQWIKLLTSCQKLFVRLCEQPLQQLEIRAETITEEVARLEEVYSTLSDYAFVLLKQSETFAKSYYLQNDAEFSHHFNSLEVIGGMKCLKSRIDVLKQKLNQPLMITNV